MKRLDKVADWYDPHTDFDRHSNRYGAKLIGTNRIKGNCLELGCASGVQSELLLEYFDDIVFLDASRKYADETAKRVRRKSRGKNVQVVCSLFEDFQPDRSYKNIVVAHFLEHVNRPVALLKKCVSMLASGGAVHIIVPNANSFHRQIGVHMGILKKVDDFSERDVLLGHRRVYSLGSLEKHVAQAGLCVDRREGVLAKFLSNAQMNEFSPALIQALFALGRNYPENSCEIYFRCRKK